MARELSVRKMSMHDKSISPNFGFAFFCRFDIHHEELLLCSGRLSLEMKERWALCFDGLGHHFDEPGAIGGSLKRDQAERN